MDDSDDLAQLVRSVRKKSKQAKNKRVVQSDESDTDVKQTDKSKPAAALQQQSAPFVRQQAVATPPVVTCHDFQQASDPAIQLSIVKAEPGSPRQQLAASLAALCLKTEPLLQAQAACAARPLVLQTVPGTSSSHLLPAPIEPQHSVSRPAAELHAMRLGSEPQVAGLLPGPELCLAAWAGAAAEAHAMHVIKDETPADPIAPGWGAWKSDWSSPPARLSPPVKAGVPLWPTLDQRAMDQHQGGSQHPPHPPTPMACPIPPIPLTPPHGLSPSTASSRYSTPDSSFTQPEFSPPRHHTASPSWVTAPELPACSPSTSSAATPAPCHPHSSAATAPSHPLLCPDSSASPPAPDHCAAAGLPGISLVGVAEPCSRLAVELHQLAQQLSANLSLSQLDLLPSSLSGSGGQEQWHQHHGQHHVQQEHHNQPAGSWSAACPAMASDLAVSIEAAPAGKAQLSSAAAHPNPDMLSGLLAASGLVQAVLCGRVSGGLGAEVVQVPEPWASSALAAAAAAAEDEAGTVSRRAAPEEEPASKAAAVAVERGPAFVVTAAAVGKGPAALKQDAGAGYEHLGAAAEPVIDSIAGVLLKPCGPPSGTAAGPAGAVGSGAIWLSIRVKTECGADDSGTPAAYAQRAPSIADQAVAASGQAAAAGQAAAQAAGLLPKSNPASAHSPGRSPSGDGGCQGLPAAHLPSCHPTGSPSTLSLALLTDLPSTPSPQPHSGFSHTAHSPGAGDSPPAITPALGTGHAETVPCCTDSQLQRAAKPNPGTMALSPDPTALVRATATGSDRCDPWEGGHPCWCDPSWDDPTPWCDPVPCWSDSWQGPAAAPAESLAVSGPHHLTSIEGQAGKEGEQAQAVDTLPVLRSDKGIVLGGEEGDSRLDFGLRGLPTVASPGNSFKCSPSRLPPQSSSPHATSPLDSPHCTRHRAYQADDVAAGPSGSPVGRDGPSAELARIATASTATNAAPSFTIPALDCEYTPLPVCVRKQRVLAVEDVEVSGDSDDEREGQLVLQRTVYRDKRSTARPGCRRVLDDSSSAESSGQRRSASNARQAASMYRPGSSPEKAVADEQGRAVRSPALPADQPGSAGSSRHKQGARRSRTVIELLSDSDWLGQGSSGAESNPCSPKDGRYQGSNQGPGYRRSPATQPAWVAWPAGGHAMPKGAGWVPPPTPRMQPPPSPQPTGKGSPLPKGGVRSPQPPPAHPPKPTPAPTPPGRGQGPLLLPPASTPGGKQPAATPGRGRKHQGLGEQQQGPAVPRQAPEKVVEGLKAPARKRMTQSAAQKAFLAGRVALAQELYASWNAAVFGGRLPRNLPLVWNPRLLSTAGQVCDDGSANARKTVAGQKIACRLELSSKLLVSEARLRTTLAHEMCHVGAWELDKEWQAPHGPAFWRWAEALMAFDDMQHLSPHSCSKGVGSRAVAAKVARRRQRARCSSDASGGSSSSGRSSGGEGSGVKGEAGEARDRLIITRLHNFETHMAHRWQCSQASCGKEYRRHRDSIDPTRHVCSQCRGKLVYLGKFARDGSLLVNPSGAPASTSRAATATPSAYNQFMKATFATTKASLPPGTPLGSVMKVVGAQWTAYKAAALQRQAAQQQRGGQGEAAHTPKPTVPRLRSSSGGKAGRGSGRSGSSGRGTGQGGERRRGSSGKRAVGQAAEPQTGLLPRQLVMVEISDSEDEGGSMGEGVAGREVGCVDLPLLGSLGALRL